MDKQKVCIIFNPAAKGEKARSLENRIRVLSKGVRLWQTEKQGAGWAGNRERVSNIVAAGGDGTVNAVVNGIADAEVELGILPLGTMNVFATVSDLELPHLGNADHKPPAPSARC